MSRASHLLADSNRNEVVAVATIDHEAFDHGGFPTYRDKCSSGRFAHAAVGPDEDVHLGGVCIVTEITSSPGVPVTMSVPFDVNA